MIDFITDLARTAGEEAMRHFGNLKPGEVSLKNSVRDLVSVADKAVEKLIVDAIRKRFPDHGIFGEEMGVKPGSVLISLNTRSPSGV